MSANTEGSINPERNDDDSPWQSIARAWDETFSALAGDDREGVEIRLEIRKLPDPRTSAGRQGLDPSELVGPTSDELLPKLRWLLTQATGTVGEVAYRLESHAADIDERARAQLQDDLLVLDGELAVVNALLADIIDWDSELKRLLDDELPRLDTDLGAEDDD